MCGTHQTAGGSIGEIMAPLYKLQIVDAASEEIVTFSGRGAVERQLVSEIADAVVKRGGWWVRREKLREAVTQAIEEVLLSLKQEATEKHFG